MIESTGARGRERIQIRARLPNHAAAARIHGEQDVRRRQAALCLTLEGRSGVGHAVGKLAAPNIVDLEGRRRDAAVAIVLCQKNRGRGRHEDRTIEQVRKRQVNEARIRQTPGVRAVRRNHDLGHDAFG